MENDLLIETLEVCKKWLIPIGFRHFDPPRIQIIDGTFIRMRLFEKLNIFPVPVNRMSDDIDYHTFTVSGYTSQNSLHITYPILISNSGTGYWYYEKTIHLTDVTDKALEQICLSFKEVDLFYGIDKLKQNSVSETDIQTIIRI